MEEKRKSPTSKPATVLPDAYGRVQPQAPDLEEAVLSACIMERDAYDTAAGDDSGVGTFCDSS
jgi:replicative DNA helicase